MKKLFILLLLMFTTLCSYSMRKKNKFFFKLQKTRQRYKKFGNATDHEIYLYKQDDPKETAKILQPGETFKHVIPCYISFKENGPKLKAQPHTHSKTLYFIDAIDHIELVDHLKKTYRYKILSSINEESNESDDQNTPTQINPYSWLSEVNE